MYLAPSFYNTGNIGCVAFPVFQKSSPCESEREARITFVKETFLNAAADLFDFLYMIFIDIAWVNDTSNDIMPAVVPLPVFCEQLIRTDDPFKISCFRTFTTYEQKTFLYI